MYCASRPVPVRKRGDRDRRELIEALFGPGEVVQHESSEEGESTDHRRWLPLPLGRCVRSSGLVFRGLSAAADGSAGRGGGRSTPPGRVREEDSEGGGRVGVDLPA